MQEPDRDGTSRRSTSLRTLVWYNYTVLKLQFEKNHLLAVVADLNPDKGNLPLSLSRERRRDTLGGHGVGVAETGATHQCRVAIRTRDLHSGVGCV